MNIFIVIIKSDRMKLVFSSNFFFFYKVKIQYYLTQKTTYDYDYYESMLNAILSSVQTDR